MPTAKFNDLPETQRTALTEQFFQNFQFWDELTIDMVKIAFMNREPRPMVIPEQDHVQICNFRRTIHIQNFRLNPQECYANTRLFFGRGRTSCIPFDPQEVFFYREQYENEQSRFIMEQNERDEIEEIDYYGFDEFDEWDFPNHSISGDDRDPLDFHSI